MTINNILMDDFTAGELNTGQKRFNFPDKAIKDGLNLELADGGFRTRAGTSVSSTGSLPVGEVMALANVRFPTNEVSYLVAQVKYELGWVQDIGPDTADWSPIAVGWNAGNSTALFFALDEFGDVNVLWEYDPDAKTWSQLATPTGTAPTALGRLIYVPSMDSFINASGWQYDCGANSWTQNSITGDVPTGTDIVYRSANNTMIVLEWSNSWLTLGSYESVDLTTWVSTEHAITADGSPEVGWPNEFFPNNGGCGFVYDAENDVIRIAMGARDTEIILNSSYWLNFTTDHWTREDDVPTGLDGDSGYWGYYCTGKFHILGLQRGTPPVWGFTYSIATSTWDQMVFESTPPSGCDLSCITDLGTILIWDQVNYKIWQTAEICGAAGSNYGYGLYASPTHLPTTAGVFTLIWEFTSEPGVCTFYPLLDRLVITEGVSDRPLVWPGAMSSDASDWPHPKQVLIAQDGVRYYDIGREVCDRDIDTVAQVGGIRRWGAIYICTDMPLVEGFYFDMETPNTGSAGTTASTYYEPVVIDAAADVTRQDLKATIVNWVQSAGATGHFTNAGAATVTLGPGNTNEDIVPGILIEFGDVELIILAIVGDGSGADSVTLSAAHASGAVVAAYGTTVSADGLSVIYQTDAATSTWTKTMGSYPVTMAGYSIRVVIPAADISTSGDHVQLILQAAKGVFAYAPTAVGFGATHVSIVERSGSTDDGVTTPTEVTFNGGESGCTTTTLAEEITSDPVAFVIDETKDYLVIVDVAWATYHDTIGANQAVERRAGFIANATGGTSYVKDPGFGNEEVSYNLQTVAGFTAQSKTLIVNKIEVATLEAVPDNAYVAHTADGIQVLTGAWELLTAVETDEVTPGASFIYHAVSFDARTTFWVFASAAWRQIVRESGGLWQYNDSATAAPNWVNAAVDSLLGALREAFGVVQNQMEKPALEAITEAEWATTGGFIPHVTTTLDFAVAMAADGTDVPRLSGYTITYGDAGQAIVEGFKDGAWTGGDGWTDNTISGGNRLGQSGSILYDGATPFEADYHVVDGVPGYWFRLLTNGTSPTCAITRIRYKAPCQPLANISNGQPDISSGVIFVNETTGASLDCTTMLSNGNYSSTGCVALPMKVGDYLYFGYDAQFNEIEQTPYGDPTDTTFTNNAVVSVATYEYWNGEAWVELTVVDGTDVAGATLATQGRVSWDLPEDWKRNIPFSAFFSRGFWVRMSVSVPLTATFAMSEARVYAVPFEIKKHRLVTGFLNRVVLLDRMDAPDQADISRELEEYGLCGQGFASLRLGGTDAINCAVEAWDSVIIGKPTTLHQLSDNGDGTFRIDTVEATRHTPVNSQSIMKAPLSGIDGGDRYGLHYPNREGMFAMSGLHTDRTFNTSRGKTLTDNFWDQKLYPHLEFTQLHRAQGVYFPPKNWLVMAVPIAWASTDPVPTTNTGLIIFDLTMQGWLPPVQFTGFDIASLCVAYHYDANSRGHIGEAGLYGGTYDGQVVRLFDPAETTDLGTAIPWFAKWGYISYGQPETEKTIRTARLYGWTDAAAGVDLTVTGLLLREDETVEDPQTVTFTRIAGATESGIDFAEPNVKGNVIEYLLEGTEYAEIEGIEIGIDGLRDWPHI